MIEMENELPENIRRGFTNILRDNTAGSGSIVRETSRLIMDMGEFGAGPSVIRDHLFKILEKHGSMAGLIHLVDETVKGLDDGMNVSEIIEAERQRRASDLSMLVGNAVDRLLSASRIVTISNSSTIIEILTSSNQMGASKEIIISEARPALEGVLAARELAMKGIKVKMVADGALPQEINGSDLVLVGADAVTEQYLMNKIGTLGLACAAREFSVPFVSTFTLDKLIGSNMYPKARKIHPPGEIMPEERGIEVSNYYFDNTPLDLVSSFITERGELKLQDILDHVEGLELHGDIRDLMQ